MSTAGILALLLAAAPAPGQVTPGGVAQSGPPRTAGGRAALPPELRGAQLIEAVVARVDRHPITRTQLDVEARLALLLHGDLAAAERPLDGLELQGALDYLIDQILLDDEAEQLGVFEVTEEESRAEVAHLAGRFPSATAYQAFLGRFGLTADLVEHSLRRGLRAERYLDDKIRVQVQGGATPAEAQRVAKDLVSQLRGRADIRLLARFAPAPSAPRPPEGQPPASPAPAARLDLP